MIERWHFTMDGSGIGGAEWHTEGDLTCEFSDASMEALRSTFALLTEGKATYGKPGPCGGPYRITKLIVEKRQ